VSTRICRISRLFHAPNSPVWGRGRMKFSRTTHQLTGGIQWLLFLSYQTKAPLILHLLF
jgi:hypothetical protein